MKKYNKTNMNTIAAAYVDNMLGLVRPNFGFDFTAKESNYVPETGLLDEHDYTINRRLRW